MTKYLPSSDRCNVRAGDWKVFMTGAGNVNNATENVNITSRGERQASLRYCYHFIRLKISKRFEI